MGEGFCAVAETASIANNNTWDKSVRDVIGNGSASLMVYGTGKDIIFVSLRSKPPAILMGANRLMLLMQRARRVDGLALKFGVKRQITTGRRAESAGRVLYRRGAPEFARDPALRHLRRRG